MPQRENGFFAGKVQFNKATIYHNSIELDVILNGDKETYGPFSVELIDIIEEISLFEDIMSPFLTGELVINDSTNILLNLPVLGQEILEMNYQTPYSDSKVNRFFYIYKVSEPIITEKKQLYKLHFVSYEATKNISTSISKAFKGNSTNIIKQIYEEFLKVDNKKPIRTLDSSDALKFVCPNWSPVKAINWVTNRAISRNSREAGFFFFETVDGFNFYDLEYLMNKGFNRPFTDILAEQTDEKNGQPQGPETAPGFYVRPGNIRKHQNGEFPTAGPKDTAEEYKQVIDFSIEDKIDFLKDVQDGALGNTLIVHDIRTKRITKYQYDYIADFEKFTHIEGSKIYSDKVQGKFYNSFVNVMPMHSRNFLDENHNYVNDWYQPRLLTRNKLNAIKISNFQINGHVNLNAGALVYFRFPQAQSSTDNASPPEDKYFKGYYLVTACRHVFQQDKHTIYMELVKDSFATEIGQ
jgi:hypothetical protein